MSARIAWVAWLAACTAGVGVAAPPDRLSRTIKPVAPIAMHYELLADPELAVPVTVIVTIEPAVDLDQVEIVVDADEGLVWGGITPSWQYASLPGGQPLRLTLAVTPMELAALRLSVHVSGEIGGYPQSRSLAIPFRLGARQAKQAPAVLKLDDSGEIIHSLPSATRGRGVLR